MAFNFIAYFVWMIVVMLAFNLLLTIFPGLRDWLNKIATACGVVMVIACILAVFGYPQLLTAILNMQGTLASVWGEGYTVVLKETLAGTVLSVVGTTEIMSVAAFAWTAIAITVGGMFMSYAIDPESMGKALSTIPEFAGEVAQTIGGTIGAIAGGVASGLIGGLLDSEYGWLLIAAGGLALWYVLKPDDDELSHATTVTLQPTREEPVRPRPSLATPNWVRIS